MFCALASSGCAKNTPARTATFKAKPLSLPPRVDTRWRVALHPSVPWDYKVQEFSRPVFMEGRESLIIGTSEGRVFRVRAGNGERMWATTLESDRDDELRVHAEPTVGEKIVWVPTLSGTIHALRLSDGKPLWEYEAEDAVEGRMAFAEGRIIAADSREVLHALDAETGKRLWRYSRQLPEAFTIKGGGSPVVDGQAVYTGFADGVLTAVQIDTGELLWATDLGDDRPEFTDVDLPVILDGERMFAASYAGGIHSVSREDGAIEWRIPIEAVSEMALDRGVLYAVSAQGRAVAIDTETRKQIWGFRFKGDTPVGVSVRGPYVFVATSAGPMHVFDAATGYPLSKWAPSTGFNNAPTFDGARAWVLSNGGYLYGVDVSRGAARSSR